MDSTVFQFYPTLLNEYHRYLQNPDEPAMSRLINRINRVPERDPEILARFKKGISFEDAVLKDTENDFNPELIEKTRNLLPKRRKTQQLLQFFHKNIRFYGYADVLGEGRVIDLKSTSNHRPGRHAFNFQNLYLYALRDAGFKTMEYLICDFEQVDHETYELQSYDFEPLLAEMESFSSFIFEHKALISDPKIVSSSFPNLFSLDD